MRQTPTAVQEWKGWTRWIGVAWPGQSHERWPYGHCMDQRSQLRV